MNDLLKKIARRKVVLGVGLLAAAAVAVTALLYQGHAPTVSRAPLKIIPENVDLQINHFHFTEVGDPNWKWEISANTARYLKKMNIAHFDHVEIKILRADGKKVVITGNKGVFHTDTKDAIVSDDVQVRIDEESLVRTEHLEYSDSEKTVRTGDAVSLTNPRLRIEARGMMFDLQQRKLSLEKNVKAIYSR